MPIDTTKAVAAELDKVAPNQLCAEVGTDGRLTGSVSTTRKGLTFTAYVQALFTGDRQVSAGLRVSRKF